MFGCLRNIVAMPGENPTTGEQISPSMAGLGEISKQIDNEVAWNGAPREHFNRNSKSHSKPYHHDSPRNWDASPEEKHPKSWYALVLLSSTYSDAQSVGWGGLRDHCPGRNSILWLFIQHSGASARFCCLLPKHNTACVGRTSLQCLLPSLSGLGWNWAHVGSLKLTSFPQNIEST